MEGSLIACIVISPISFCICLYGCFNNGQLPCIDTTYIDTHNYIIPDN